MNVKIRNWLLGGLAIAVFILGVPLAQQVIANAGSSARSAERADECAAHEDMSKREHPSIVRLDDGYLQFIPSKDGSVGALLYDSTFTLIAANENEASLSFPLPNGEKKTVKITVPDFSQTSGAHGSSAFCPATAEGAAQESRAHDREGRG